MLEIYGAAMSETGKTAEPAARGVAPCLSPRELAVLGVLVDSHGKVVGRREIARRIGLSDVNERRCDSLLVAVRRSLGPESIRTVRGRGWIIAPEFVDRAKVLLDESHESLTQSKHSQDSGETRAI